MHVIILMTVEKMYKMIFISLFFSFFYRGAQLLSLNLEVSVIVCILRAGCSFFSHPFITPTDTYGISAVAKQSTHSHAAVNQSTDLVPMINMDSECCEIAISENSLILFQTVSTILNNFDCWRLLLSTMTCHSINCEQPDKNDSHKISENENQNLKKIKMFNELIENDILATMITIPQYSILSDKNRKLINTIDPLRNFPKNISNFENLNKEDFYFDEKKNERVSFADFENIFFEGYTLGGWAVRLNNIAIMKNILSVGYNSSQPGDILGNNLLHLAAKYSNKEMVDLLYNEGNTDISCVSIINHIAYPRSNSKNCQINIESENYYGFTPLMEGIRMGNEVSVKQLFYHGGDLKKGLQGKYCSWVLVLLSHIKEDEKKMKNNHEKKRIFSYFGGEENLKKVTKINFQNLQKNNFFVLNRLDLNLLQIEVQKLLEIE